MLDVSQTNIQMLLWLVSVTDPSVGYTYDTIACSAAMTPSLFDKGFIYHYQVWLNAFNAYIPYQTWRKCLCICWREFIVDVVKQGFYGENDRSRFLADCCLVPRALFPVLAHYAIMSPTQNTVLCLYYPLVGYQRYHSISGKNT